MEETREVTLSSGAVLKIQLATFAEGKELYQSVLEDLKDLELNPEAEVDVNFFKDIFCTAFSSKKIEKAVWKCLRRCTYNDEKITEQTFEKVSAREDYFQILMEVAQFNVLPFGKNLFAEYWPILQEMLKSQKPTLKTT